MTPNPNPSDASGFAIALSFFLYAAVWVAAPGNYFTGIALTSDGALACYTMALLLLAIGVYCFGSELSNREVSTFLKEVVAGNLPKGTWGSPSSMAWEYGGIAFGSIILSSAVHLIGIELLDATGVVGGIIKVVVLVSLVIPVMFFASTADELAIKPLLLTPASRLTEASETEVSETTENISRAQTTGGLLSLAKPVAVGIIVVGDFLGALYMFWQIITRILGAI